MSNKAIGLINTDISKEFRARDEQLIRDLAAQRGYTLVGLLTINDDIYRPTTLIVHTARIREATVLVAPGLAHVGDAANAIAGVCVVETPDATFSRATAG